MPRKPRVAVPKNQLVPDEVVVFEVAITRYGTLDEVLYFATCEAKEHMATVHVKFDGGLTRKSYEGTVDYEGRYYGRYYWPKPLDSKTNDN